MQPEPPLQAVPISQANCRQDEPGGRATVVHHTIFFFLALFVILLPHSIKGARYAWMIAFCAWLISLAIERKRMFEQPLALPMLAYIGLSGLSTILSPDPYMSWGNMKVVCSVALVGTLFAQNLRRLSQVRILVILLLLSATAAAGFTAWQYTYGIGVRLSSIGPDTPLYHAGLRPNDVIVKINGEPIHTPQQLLEALDRSAPGSLVSINFLRGLPTSRRRTTVRVVPGDLGTQSLGLVRAKPVRAQGTLGHYGILAEVLMPIGCLAWSMMLSAQPRKPMLRVLFVIIFLSLAMTIIATQTRAPIAGLAVGCFVALLLLAGMRVRMWGIGLLGGLILVATFWIHHFRRLGWIGVHDAGTSYRLLMWQDGLRLVRQHPWFGVGMGTVVNHWQEWNIRAYALYHVQYHFHSDLVQLAVERGLPTLAAWLWFVVANLIFLVGLFGRVRQRSRFAAGVVVGVFASFVALLVPSLVEFCLNDETLVMLLFFYFGMAVAIDRMLKVPGAIEVEQ